MMMRNDVIIERRFTNTLLFKHRQRHTCIYYNAIVNKTT